MDPSTASWPEFLELIDGTGRDTHQVGSALDRAVATVRAAIPTYAGMRVSLVVERQPVHLDVFLASDNRGEVTTSLRLPLAFVLGSAADGRIVFYASNPGAFVDLAADLRYLGDTSGLGTGIDWPGGEPELDADLPPVSLRSGLTGLDLVSAIGRAAGILIAQGHLPENALAELYERAAAAGLSPQSYAARLLKR